MGFGVTDSGRTSLVPRTTANQRVQLHRKLQRPPEEIAERFRSLSTPDDIADLLELPWSQLHYITSRGIQRYPYRTFTIPKKNGGSRSIQSPSRTVRILQRKLLEALILVYKPHPAAHGFVPRKGILSNAKKHEGSRLMLNVDIEDFFPSIEFSRVRGVFIRRFGLPENVSTVLARLCCNTGDAPDHLPQGAPTSPIISNMICHSMDRDLVRLSRRYGLYYTRYADDLTFSTRRNSFPLDVAHVVGDQLEEVGPELLDIITEHGFELSAKKSRAASRASRLSVTGLTVNEFANVPRRYVRAIRGMLHAWQRYGVMDTQTRFERDYDRYGGKVDFRTVLQGHLSFIRSIRGVDDRVFRRLYESAASLDSTRFPALPTLATRADSLLDALRDFPAVSPSDGTIRRVQYFRRSVASAKGTLWIVDPWLTTGVVEEVARCASDLQVSSVRFLSEDRGKVRRIDVERAIDVLAERGIEGEWRIAQRRRQFHDRWIGDDHDWIAVGGPIAAIHDARPAYSQNHATSRPALLSQWWEAATSALA